MEEPYHVCDFKIVVFVDCLRSAFYFYRQWAFSYNRICCICKEGIGLPQHWFNKKNKFTFTPIIVIPTSPQQYNRGAVHTASIVMWMKNYFDHENIIVCLKKKYVSKINLFLVSLFFFLLLQNAFLCLNWQPRPSIISPPHPTSSQRGASPLSKSLTIFGDRGNRRMSLGTITLRNSTILCGCQCLI